MHFTIIHSRGVVVVAIMACAFWMQIDNPTARFNILVTLLSVSLVYMFLKQGANNRTCTITVGEDFWGHLYYAGTHRNPHPYVLWACVLPSPHSALYLGFWRTNCLYAEIVFYFEQVELSSITWMLEHQSQQKFWKVMHLFRWTMILTHFCCLVQYTSCNNWVFVSFVKKVKFLVNNKQFKTGLQQHIGGFVPGQDTYTYTYAEDKSLAFK